MSDYAVSVQSAQVSTGNPATVNDAYDTTKLSNGAKNVLGRKYYGTITSTANPDGYPVAYRYVRYNPTTTIALHASGASQNVPSIVYWKDTTFTVVTPNPSEAVGAGGAASVPWVAGILLGAPTDGNFTFIQVSGLCPKAVTPASTTFGDALVGSSLGTLTFGRIAASTAGAYGKVTAFGAGTSLATGPLLSDIMVVIEDFGG